jgi:hypothetical protein
VRDNVVCTLLGLLPKGDYQVDWQVFRHLTRDREVLDAIAAACEATTQSAEGATLVIDQEPLRVLDAALWSSVTMADPVEASA